MGRAKLKMELIKKEKVRHTTFHIRKNSLKKKVYELSTLCGIKAMLIIKQATPHARPLEPEIFPDNHDEVLKLIDIYKGQSSEDRKKRTSLVSYFFQERTRKAQQVLARLRNTNVQSRYPTWDSRFSSYIEDDLRRIAAFLENKIANAKAKLGQMKANSNNSNNIYCAYLQQPRMLTEKRSMDFEAGNQTSKYLVTIDPHKAGFTRVPVPVPMPMPMPMPMPIQQQKYPFIDHYQNQRRVRFGYDNIGGTSNIAHPSRSLYNYPTLAETRDNIIYLNNLGREPPNNYIEDRQPLAQHFMEYHPIMPGSTPHQMVATSHQTDIYAQFNSMKIGNSKASDMAAYEAPAPFPGVGAALALPISDTFIETPLLFLLLHLSYLRILLVSCIYYCTIINHRPFPRFFWMCICSECMAFAIHGLPSFLPYFF